MARKIKIPRAPKKEKYLARGGPMDDRFIWLTTPETLVFTLAGQTGRYIQDPHRIKTLSWKSSTV